MSCSPSYSASSDYYAELGAFTSEKFFDKPKNLLKTPCGAHTPFGIILSNFSGIAFLPLREVFCGFLQAVRSGSWVTWNSGVQQSGEGRMVWQKLN